MSVPKCFVIGDMHITPQFLEKEEKIVFPFLIATAKAQKPDFIVILGDVLHDHGRVDVMCHNSACDLIEELGRVAPVVVLIGNHDYINGKQYLTNNHIFNPLKLWPNTTIIDSPTIKTIGEKSFMFCPFVPDGKLISSLNEVSRSGDVWELCDAVFAHTDPLSSKDKWDSRYPPLITGHIHTPYTKGNIYICGSIRNVGFGDLGDKFTWMFRFGDVVGHKKFKVPNTELRIVSVRPSDIQKLELDGDSVVSSNTKIRVVGSRSEISEFKNSDTFTNLTNKGVKFAPIVEEKVNSHKLSRETFNDTLETVVNTKSNIVQETYNKLFGNSSK